MSQIKARPVLLGRKKKREVYPQPIFVETTQSTFLPVG